jgi:hypothetical protein
VGPQPNYMGNDLHEIADQLIVRYPGQTTKAPEAA